MDFVAPKATQALILAALVAGGGLLDGAQVSLYQNDETPDADSERGDFTDADYTGNGDEAVTWLDPTIADDGTPELVGTVGEFRPTGTGTTNTIYGCLLNTSGDALIQGAKFDAPVAMAAVTDSLLVTVRVRCGLTGLVVLVS